MKHPHSAVHYAVRKGELNREPCSKCGASEAEAHHEDYNKPLDVIWLCPKCHAQRHKELKRQPNGYVPLPPVVLKNFRINIVVTKPQHVWLEREAKRLGLTIGELIRRIIDNTRDSK